jgi:hypothetical protein
MPGGSSKRQQPHRPKVPAIGQHRRYDLLEWPLLTFLPLVHTEVVLPDLVSSVIWSVPAASEPDRSGSRVDHLSQKSGSSPGCQIDGQAAPFQRGGGGCAWLLIARDLPELPA